MYIISAHYNLGYNRKGCFLLGGSIGDPIGSASQAYIL